jgi:hypothetical protein
MCGSKAKEIVKNLTATIQKLVLTRTENTVKSKNSSFKSSRASLSELKKRRKELITKYNLNGNTK